MTEAPYKKIIAQNKKALFNYFIEERIEAGIMLLGSEVKSMRLGRASIDDSHASNSGNEVFYIIVTLRNMKKQIDLIILLEGQESFFSIIKK